MIDALGLVRDPSRGRTHIVFKQVEHVPNAKAPRDKFRIAAAGVFKLDDIWLDLEGIMGLNPGEGKTYIKEMLEEFDHGPGNRLGGDAEQIPFCCVITSTDRIVPTPRSRQAPHPP